MNCDCENWSIEQWASHENIQQHVLSMNWGDFWTKHFRITLAPTERYMLSPDAPPHLITLIQNFERKHNIVSRPLHRLEYDEMYIIYIILLAFEKKHILSSLQLFKNEFLRLVLQKYLPVDLIKCLLEFI